MRNPIALFLLYAKNVGLHNKLNKKVEKFFKKYLTIYKY